MPGNETQVNLRFKVQDDGSIKLDKIGKGFENIKKNSESMNNSLKLIKFDSIINLGERAFRAGEQIYNLMYSTASLGSEIQRMSRTLGMSTDEYQQWQYVAKACDVEAEQLMLGIRVLTKNMGDLRTGTGEAKDALAKIGITAKDSNKSIGELLPLIINKLSQIGSVAEQNQLAMEIFGSRSGLAIANMVREGKNIDDIIKRFNELGGAISETTIEKLAKSEQAFKDMAVVWKSFTAEVLAPLVEGFAGLLTYILKLKKETEKQIEIQVKYTPIITKGEQKVDDYYLMMAGFGTEKAIEEDLKKAIENVQPRMQDRWKEWVSKEYKPIPKTGGGEVRDVFGMTEADHARSKNNLEWYSHWVTDEFIPSLKTLPMGEAAAAEGIITQWVKSDIENAEKASKEYWDKQLSDSHRYDKMIRGAQQAEMIYGFPSMEAEAKASLATMKNELNPIKNFMTELSSGISSAWSTNLTGILRGTENFADGMKKLFQSMGDTIISSLTKIIMNMTLFGNMTGTSGTGGLMGGLGSLVKGVGGLFSTGGGGHEAGLRGYQHGIDYVPYDQIAYVHRGESIIPADENKKGGVFINIVNQTPNSKVETKESQDGRGNRSIDILISELVGKEISRTGSAPNRAIQAMGGSDKLIRR
jgi:hypothetical protein